RKKLKPEPQTRYRGQSHVDHDQPLHVHRDLPHQDRRPRKQKCKRDQVVEHAVANGFAKSVVGNVSDTRVHAIAPAVFSGLRNFSTKYSSSVVLTGTREIRRRPSRRKASSAMSWLSSGNTARTVSPVT